MRGVACTCQKNTCRIPRRPLSRARRRWRRRARRLFRSLFDSGGRRRTRNPGTTAWTARSTFIWSTFPKTPARARDHQAAQRHADARVGHAGRRFAHRPAAGNVVWMPHHALRRGRASRQEDWRDDLVRHRPARPAGARPQDIGYYSRRRLRRPGAETRSVLQVGRRYWFQPRMCMLQWRHSGLLNYLSRNSDGYQVRVEGAVDRIIARHKGRPLWLAAEPRPVDAQLSHPPRSVGIDFEQRGDAPAGLRFGLLSERGRPRYAA